MTEIYFLSQLLSSHSRNETGCKLPAVKYRTGLSGLCERVGRASIYFFKESVYTAKDTDSLSLAFTNFAIVIIFNHL